jgi:hypothetical protein
MAFRNCVLFVFLLYSLALPGRILSLEYRGIGITPRGPSPASYLGNYHALIIGINDYQQWNRLNTAVKDAQSLREIIIRKYGFKEEAVVIRIDAEATRSRIITDLRVLAAGLEKKDNLLIYFAGHGQLDDLTGDGYWIPVEGELKDPSTWISHSVIKSILSSERISAKNIVVIADSCYSGTLLRGGPSQLDVKDQEYREKLLRLASRRSRQVITSGGLEPVADGGRDGHSLFAYYLLKALEDNQRDLIDLENLFHNCVWEPVTEIGGQRPGVGRLKTPMDEDGQFVLVSNSKYVAVPEDIVQEAVPESTRKAPANDDKMEILFWESIKDSNSAKLYDEYLQRFPEGVFVEVAKVRIAQLKESPPAPQQATRNSGIQQASVSVDQPQLARSDFRPKLAVFPWYISKAASKRREMKQYTATCIGRIVARGKEFDPAYSYYDLGDAILCKKISDDFIENNTEEDLWSGFFKPKPNVKEVSRLGEILGVDLVLMYAFIQKGTSGNWDSRIYMIDVAKKVSYSKKEVISNSTIANEVHNFTRDFLTSYERHISKK